VEKGRRKKIKIVPESAKTISGKRLRDQQKILTAHGVVLELHVVMAMERIA